MEEFVKALENTNINNDKKPDEKKEDKAKDEKESGEDGDEKMNEG